MQLLSIEKHSSGKNTLAIVLEMDITKELNKARGMGRHKLQRYVPIANLVPQTESRYGCLDQGYNVLVKCF